MGVCIFAYALARLSVCACVCIYAHTRVCMCVRVCVSACVCVCVSVSVPVSVRACEWMCVVVVSRSLLTFALQTTSIWEENSRKQFRPSLSKSCHSCSPLLHQVCVFLKSTRLSVWKGWHSLCCTLSNKDQFFAHASVNEISPYVLSFSVLQHISYEKFAGKEKWGIPTLTRSLHHRQNVSV